MWRQVPRATRLLLDQRSQQAEEEEKGREEEEGCDVTRPVVTLAFIVRTTLTLVV